MITFGLVGKNISYSFSKAYFLQKFKDLGLENHKYVNFDLDRIEEFPGIISEEVKGLNVTIPYKEAIIPFLDEIDQEANRIGAVNTIKVIQGKLIGYNTDTYGFEHSLRLLLKPYHKKALILGTGGASKAVRYTLEKLKIKHLTVSRDPEENQVAYQDLDRKILEEHQIIINCTPLGTFPDVEKRPDIPYQCITRSHLLYDLIYNPEKTIFLIEGEKRGAIICNGLSMLKLQAERSWEIWNSRPYTGTRNL